MDNLERIFDEDTLPREHEIVRTKINCICCLKELEIDEHDCIYGGGEMKLSFGYGSIHDQGAMVASEEFTQAMTGRSSCHNKKLLADEMEAYLCDDCFDERKHLIRGFNVEVKKSREEVK